ncbi:MAG: 2Fe-2S iron-sulfur cluster-binding protein [Firmicutes bacterium]|nr:2Fe-2S iron-sulfur cluster-binding protein [Bacillota bacterium]
MVNFILNGLEVSVLEGTTLLEAARFYGLEIPTLCHHEGLTPYGACRLCLVEIGTGSRSRLVTSCTYQATEGLQVRTASNRAVKARRLLLEMYLATCPSSKVLQDLASKHHVTQVRFRTRHEDCILCGLCVRMCEEQMQAKALGFTGRGEKREVTTFFRKKSRDCRLCGACMYICPVCQARCQGPEEKSAVCNACLNLAPPCLEKFDDMMCYLEPCVACEADSAAKK